MGKWPVERCVYHKIAGIMFSGSPELWWLAIFNTIVGAHACSLSSWKWPPNHHLHVHPNSWTIYVVGSYISNSTMSVILHHPLHCIQVTFLQLQHYIVYKSRSCSSNITLYIQVMFLQLQHYIVYKSCSCSSNITLYTSHVLAAPTLHMLNFGYQKCCVSHFLFACLFCVFLVCILVYETFHIV